MKFGRTLSELAMELDRQNSEKKDYLVDTRTMTMDASENTTQLSIQNNKTGETLIFGINEVAHNQIGQRLGIPSKYYDKMRAQNPELLAQNVNSWLYKEPEQRMIRVLDGNVRAFLSDRYRRIDNFEVAQHVLPIIAEMMEADGARVESCEVTEERMYLKVVNPRLTTDIVPGDTVQSGMLISNSEVGLGSLTVQPLIYRLVCTNGMVVNDARTRKYHVGRGNMAAEDFSLFSDETLRADDHALMLKIQDTVRAVIDETRFEKVVGMMRQAKEAKIKTSYIPEMVELGATDFGYTKEEGKGILDYLIRGNDLSLYGYANATTRYAQDVKSYDRSTALEAIGYNILGMSQRQWNKLQNIEKIAA